MIPRVALVALAVACAGSPPASGGVSDGRTLMGTVLEITLHGAGASRGLLEELYAETARLESLYTRFDPRSDVSRLNAHAGQGPVPVAPEVARLLGACMRYSELTAGSFDVTVGPLVELWTEAGRRGRWPAPADLSRARAAVGSAALRVDERAGTAELLRAGMSVDLGGVAKGTALDALVARLRKAGVRSALLSFGQSSLHALGAPPGEDGWRVLLEDAGRGYAGVLVLRDRALAVSASLEQSVEIEARTLGHVLDPRTGEPLQRRRVAAILAPSGELAEALAKALLVLEPEEALRLLDPLDGVEALLLDADGRRWSTPDSVVAARFVPVE